MCSKGSRRLMKCFFCRWDSQKTLVMLHNSEEVIKFNIKHVRFLVRNYTIPISWQWVVYSFCPLVIKIRELSETTTLSFSFFRTRMKLIPVQQETTVMKYGWLVLGNVKVKFFVVDGVICWNSVYSSISQLIL